MKRRVNWSVEETVVERAKDTVYWTPGHPSLSNLVEQALRELIDRLEDQRGEPFAPRPDGATSSGTDG